ncbi:MAG: hypothetical protein JXJ04_06345 [Spirochaetales bacterium]|nr:hypothetical protein [Spirochaetales bacterium]
MRFSGNQDQGCHNAFAFYDVMKQDNDTPYGQQGLHVKCRDRLHCRDKKRETTLLPKHK